MVLKYFLAEGVSHGNYLMCASANESSWEIVIFYYTIISILTIVFT